VIFPTNAPSLLNGPGETYQASRVESGGWWRAELAGTVLAFFWQPGTASAFDAVYVSGGDDIGATVVLIPQLDAEALTFNASDDGFVDDQAGSTWNLLGTAVDGPLGGTHLVAVRPVTSSPCGRTRRCCL
jgi:hypothetical protein